MTANSGEQRCVAIARSPALTTTTPCPTRHAGARTARLLPRRREGVPEQRTLPPACQRGGGEPVRGHEARGEV